MAKKSQMAPLATHRAMATKWRVHLFSFVNIGNVQIKKRIPTEGILSILNVYKMIFFLQ
jgi:hypothetical protein